MTWLDPSWVGLVVSFFLIPLGVLALSWLVQNQFHMRLNSGLDLFTFLVVLDLTYLSMPATGQKTIYPEVVPYYGHLFALLLITSFAFMVYAARVQERIQKHLRDKRNFYPRIRVNTCWFFALISIGLHGFITLGGQR